MSNLQPLKWRETSVSASARTPMHSYEVIATENNKFYVKKVRLETQELEEVTGFDTAQAAKDWCFNKHYAVKMQPYVKPMPTWIDASEQLPSVDTDTQFICAYDSAIDTFSKVVWFNADIGEFNYQHDDVLAWMPIPEFSTMQNLHKGGDCE